MHGRRFAASPSLPYVISKAERRKDASLSSHPDSHQNFNTSHHKFISFPISDISISSTLGPEACVHDNGGEFVGYEFQLLLEQCGIRSRPTTSRNPTANAICERMHQTVGNILRTILHGETVTAATAEAIVDEALATAMHALRSSISRSLDLHSPGEIVFNRHMFLNLPVLADLHALHAKRSEIVLKNLEISNRRRIRHVYVAGERVLLTNVESKLGNRAEGPFLITQVHTNGTVTIQRRPFVTERLNIRRLMPLP